VSSVGLQPDQQVQSRPAGLFQSATLRAIGCALLLALLSLALYYPARSHGWVNYDDNVYVTDNSHIKDGLTWDTVNWALVTYEAGNWHPVTWLSHALDFQLYGPDPAGHHQTNLLLHALNAAILFLVLLSATGYAGRSFMVAALFAVHPINVEPVVWVAERKTLLSMLFLLLALGAYQRYVSKPNALRYTLVAVLFALGLMSKPQVITFPCLLLLWDYWPLKRIAVRQKAALRSSLFAFRQRSSSTLSGEQRKAKSEERLSGEKRKANSEQRTAKEQWLRLVVEKLPLFCIAGASAAITMQAQGAGGSVLSLEAVPLSMRLSNAIVSYVRYIGKAFWPVRLAPMYPHPANLLRAWQVYVALLLLLAITVFVFDQRKRRGYLIVGWLWFLGTLVPMIGLVQVGRQAMADRYAYLPLIGIFIMVCWGVADWAEENRVPAMLLPVASLAIIVALSLVARRQIGYWADNQLLWTHTIEVTLPNYIAEDNLGGTLEERGHLDQAIVHYRRAAAIHPTDPISAFNIAYYEQRHGNLRESIEQYKRSIVLTTRTSLKVLALRNMGYAYGDLGEHDQARQCFDEAMKLQAP